MIAHSVLVGRLCEPDIKAYENDEPNYRVPIRQPTLLVGDDYLHRDQGHAGLCTDCDTSQLFD